MPLIKKILVSVAESRHDKQKRDAWLPKKSGTKPSGFGTIILFFIDTLRAFNRLPVDPGAHRREIRSPNLPAVSAGVK
jgi:hypothetical protein